MTEKKKQQLKKEVKEINDILLLAQEALKIVGYLSEEDDEISYLKKANEFFGFTLIVYWRVIVIELSKLFGERETEHFNIHKFISKLKRSGHYRDAKISAEKIAAWENEIKKEKEIIENLLQQRDKIYAHTDRKHKEVLNKLSIKNFQRLVKIIQVIICTIYFDIFESAYLINEPIDSPVEKLKWIMNMVAQHKKSDAVVWEERKKRYKS